MSEENRWLTIGIEEEFQIVDQEGHLRSHIDTLLEQATPTLGVLKGIASPEVFRKITFDNGARLFKVPA